MPLNQEESEALVATYTTITTTSLTSLLETLIEYHEILGTALLRIPGLEPEYKAQILASDKSQLIRLRAYIGVLEETTKNALRSGSF